MNLVTPFSLAHLAASAANEQSGPDAGDIILVIAAVVTLLLTAFGLIAYTRRQRNADERAVSLSHDPQLRLETYKTMSIAAPRRRPVGGVPHLVLVNRGQSDALNVQVQILQWDSQQGRRRSFRSIRKDERTSLGVLQNEIRYVELNAEWETIDGKRVKRPLTWKRG